MWKLSKSGLWVKVNTPEGESNASSSSRETEESSMRAPGKSPRPHVVTIILGILSPTLALLALCISFKSVWLGERSLKIANRAYVAVTGGNIKFSNHAVMPDEGSSGRGLLVVRMDLSVTLQNSGNTPAVAGSFHPAYQLPRGWRRAPDWIRKRFGNETIGSIQGKSSLIWRFTDFFELDPEEYNAFRDMPGTRVIYLSAQVDHRDVFDEPSRLRWCWVAATNEKYTGTENCGSEMKLLFPR